MDKLNSNPPTDMFAELVDDFKQKLQLTEVGPLWKQLAHENALVGIGTPDSPLVDATQASLLLADLLPYPEHSSARSPKAKANINWWDEAKRSVSTVQSTDPHFVAIPPGRTLGMASPYPPVFITERIAALARLGADPVKTRALMRATFRKCPEEIRAIIGLPSCPSPGTINGRGGSALHRASYQGPNHIFALLVNISSPQDWLSIDDKGRMPIDKACQSTSLSRPLICARLMSWNPTPADAMGETPLHPMARALSGLDVKKKGDYQAWSDLFSELAVRLGPDCFFMPNKAGQSPFSLVNHLELRDAMRLAQAKASSVAIASVTDASPVLAQTQRQRL